MNDVGVVELTSKEFMLKLCGGGRQGKDGVGKPMGKSSATQKTEETRLRVRGKVFFFSLVDVFLVAGVSWFICRFVRGPNSCLAISPSP